MKKDFNWKCFAIYELNFVNDEMFSEAWAILGKINFKENI